MLRLLIGSLLLVFLSHGVQAQKKPPRPQYSSKCNRLAMQFDEETNRWKCIFERRLRRNYTASRTESAARPRAAGVTEALDNREQVQRDRQLRTEQEQRLRQLQTEQDQRAEAQRRYTQQLIRDIQQRTRQ